MGTFWVQFIFENKDIEPQVDFPDSYKNMILLTKITGNDLELLFRKSISKNFKKFMVKHM